MYIHTSQYIHIHIPEYIYIIYFQNLNPSEPINTTIIGNHQRHRSSVLDSVVAHEQFLGWYHSFRQAVSQSLTYSVSEWVSE